MYGAPELGKDRTIMWASADCYALSLTCLQLMAGQTLDDFYIQGGWTIRRGLHRALVPLTRTFVTKPALRCLRPLAKHAQPPGTLHCFVVCW